MVGNEVIELIISGQYSADQALSVGEVRPLPSRATYAFLPRPCLETIDLKMASREHRNLKFLKVSPFGLVPAVDDNGFTFLTSTALLAYLTQKYPDGHA